MGFEFWVWGVDLRSLSSPRVRPDAPALWGWVWLLLFLVLSLGSGVRCVALRPCLEREFFIDNLLVRIHLTIEMIWWTSLAPWEFDFRFSGSLASTFLALSGRTGVCAPDTRGTPPVLCGLATDALYWVGWLMMDHDGVGVDGGAPDQPQLNALFQVALYLPS